MIKEYYKHPRLYLKQPLSGGATLSLAPEQAHYLKTVLRKGAGDIVRVFNGADGEWFGALEVLDKKAVSLKLQGQIRVQKPLSRRVHLYFAPIKKQRLDILIEKAVELGVTDVHPVLTHRTENRVIRPERLEAQIFEAAEQCERLEIPVLHAMVTLPQALRGFEGGKVFACLEREQAEPLAAQDFSGDIGFLIGPEGGFDDGEIEMIMRSCAVPVTLGEAVLRAETAVMACLTFIKLRS